MQNKHGIYFASWEKKTPFLDMSYLEVFGVLTEGGVDVWKFFGVWAEVFKPETEAESESEKCDSANLWLR